MLVRVGLFGASVGGVCMQMCVQMRWATCVYACTHTGYQYLHGIYNYPHVRTKNARAHSIVCLLAHSLAHSLSTLHPTPNRPPTYPHSQQTHTHHSTRTVSIYETEKCEVVSSHAAAATMLAHKHSEHILMFVEHGILTRGHGCVVTSL